MTTTRTTPRRLPTIKRGRPGQSATAGARTRLRLHLDLSPEETEFERLAGETSIPSGIIVRRSYLPDYCRILAGPAPPAADMQPDALDMPATRRRIRNVRRQFEALRPRGCTSRVRSMAR